MVGRQNSSNLLHLTTMNLQIERKKDTQVLLEISATKEELLKIKSKVLKTC